MNRQDNIPQGKMFITIISLSLILLLISTGCRTNKPVEVIYLDELGAQHVISGWGDSKANKSIDGNALTVAGQVYERGLGTHAESQCRIKLDGRALSFKALVGVDDEVKKTQAGAERASVEFILIWPGQKE